MRKYRGQRVDNDKISIMLDAVEDAIENRRIAKTTF